MGFTLKVLHALSAFRIKLSLSSSAPLLNFQSVLRRFLSIFILFIVVRPWLALGQWRLIFFRNPQTRKSGTICRASLKSIKPPANLWKRFEKKHLFTHLLSQQLLPIYHVKPKMSWSVSINYNYSMLLSEIIFKNRIWCISFWK